MNAERVTERDKVLLLAAEEWNGILLYFFNSQTQQEVWECSLTVNRFICVNRLAVLFGLWLCTDIWLELSLYEYLHSVLK